ncbi:LytTR family transcriptional regulator DNA-binding domain-containing protein [Streptococcus sp. 15.1]|jgi:regulatory protein|uniref:LytTR family DNA-binding domain-containing protein n=1 Tax=Streptococcus sp. 15.1 TaxID=2762569 RepID=UPI0019146B10|nr:LytTR family DNA-binding domain-containing protein [Streptococcus sp. 15.1]MBK5034532.1 LytTR family transcriptional regulator DNA-binding domain-containing protein [Streptococcus sp. 15.1]
MDYFIAKKGTKSVKIQIGDILYIGTLLGRPRVLQFITDNEVYEAYGKLKDFELILGSTFRRCHRKYLVNLSRIKAIDTGTRQIILDNGKVGSIECSRRNLNEVFEAWKDF